METLRLETMSRVGEWPMTSQRFDQPRYAASATQGPPAICAAVAQALRRSGLTQQEIASRLNQKQQTISGWARRREPRLDDLSSLEVVLGRPRGYLLRAAGYVEEQASARQALVADPALGERELRIVLAAYDAAVCTDKPAK